LEGFLRGEEIVFVEEGLALLCEAVELPGISLAGADRRRVGLP